MQIELVLRCDARELLLVAAAIESVEEVLAELAAGETGIPTCVDPDSVAAPPETEEVDASTAAARAIVEQMFDPEQVAEMKAAPKKRGRKPKSRPDEVLAQLKESVAETPEVPSNVVPLKKPDPIEDAVFGVPETAPAEVGAIDTGQKLQEYILGLVHQKRLDPTAVKATVYPKYGVIRSLDLKPEQVAAAKADVDAMLKGGPAPAKNDLDL